MRDIVVEVEHAAPFTAAAMLAIGQRDDHDVGMFEDMARNPERLRQAQPFGFDIQLQRHQYCTVIAISPNWAAK